MKYYFTLFITLFVLVLNTKAQWQQIQTVPLFTNGYCIEAIGDDFAVMSASQSKISITQDAGITWTQKSLPKNNAIDISLVSKTIFYVAADDGTFYKTTDGGDNWTIIYSNPQKTGYGNYIEMFTPTDGIAMGDGDINTKIPLFIKTTNGINWTETCTQSIGGAAADGWKSLDFVNSNIGYYSPKAGPIPRRLWKTNNGGLNWTETSFDVYADVLKFYNKDFGILAHFPTVYRTLDGANTWKDFPSPVSGFTPPALDIEFVPNNPNKVWMSYYNGLFFSNDSGKTWLQQSIPNTTNTFFDITFANEEIGWLLCTNGKLFYTNNCGGYFTSDVQEKILPEDFELSQNYPNPFNPVTTISYSIPKQSSVKLKIYDLLGNEIAVLINEEKSAGNYDVKFNGSSLPSGVYFYTLQAGDFYQTRKLVLLK
ncbi:MAG: T9SS type A sorting domain-containing protein [Ignavibacteriales bacterium]|nr:T9SS type A sorting domain-containing protein [Ignavibacteriales bacterium]